MGANDAKAVGARAKEVRSELGLQQQEMALELGLSLRGWQKLERGEGIPSGETLLQFEKVGINPGWILTGLGPKRQLDDTGAHPVTPIEVPASEFRKLQETVESLAEAVASPAPAPTYREQLFEPKPAPKVRYYPVYASAGYGLTALYESPGADLDIDEFCDLAFRTSARHVMMFPIKGDSMLPTFAHGDFAAIDRRVSGEPEDGKIYLFSVDGDLYLKRADWQADGSLLLLSDNTAPGFVPMHVEVADLSKMKVLGQAIGVVHAL